MVPNLCGHCNVLAKQADGKGYLIAIDIEPRFSPSTVIHYKMAVSTASLMILVSYYFIVYMSCEVVYEAIPGGPSRGRWR